MNIIKEAFILIKMFFGLRPEDDDELELVSMDHFPFKGNFAMMWCGRFIYRKEYEKRVINELERSPELLHHEFIHLCQAKQYKTWIKYYLLYFWEWLKGYPLFNPHSGAYYTIPFEVEAKANEDNLLYTTIGALIGSKYDLKKRVSTYQKNRLNWKEYITKI